MTVYIGVDPGVSGAIAVIDGNVITVHDMPAAVVRNTKRDYLIPELYTMLLAATQDAADSAVAALEKGIPMPNQSSTTTYHTGRGGGIVEGLLTGLGIPYDLVEPKKWKKALGIPAGSDKDASRVLAQRLFPHIAHALTRKLDHGRADALLLAEWRRRLG